MADAGIFEAQTWSWVAGLVLAACAASCAGKAITNDRNAAGGSSARPDDADAGNAGIGSRAGQGGSGGFVTGSPGSAGALTASSGGATNTASGGATSTAAGGAAVGSGATAGALTFDSGVPITPTEGWVDGASNVLNIQGALFAASDPTTTMGLSADLLGPKACMTGTAARVDMASEVCTTKMFPPPATDCYGYFWGAELGLNLNQALDSVTMGGATPKPFNASALKGFAFDIAGDTVPGPASLRFQVETEDQVFCNPASKKIKVGSNVVLFSELITRCFAVSEASPTAETVKASLIRISWNVVTNASATVPFNFCVSNIRALLE